MGGVTDWSHAIIKSRILSPSVATGELKSFNIKLFGYNAQPADKFERCHHLRKEIKIWRKNSLCKPHLMKLYFP